MGWAADPFVVNWKFNPQKSKVERPENFKDYRQRIVAVAPNSVELTETRIGPDGKLQSIVNTIIFDGKEHTWQDGTHVTYVRPTRAISTERYRRMATIKSSTPRSRTMERS